MLDRRTTPPRALLCWSLALACALQVGCGQEQQLVRLLQERAARNAAATSESTATALETPLADRVHAARSSADSKLAGSTAAEAAAEISSGIATVRAPLAAGEPSSEPWGFSADTQLTTLPPVCHSVTPFVGLPARSPVQVERADYLGVLLAPVSPPQPAAPQVEPLAEALAEIAVAEAAASVAPVQRPALRRDLAAVRPALVLGDDELSPEERRIVEVIAQDALAISTGVQTDVRLDQQSREKIGSAYVLAQRGASYAARQELIEVLRLISQAKDVRDGTRTRSDSLAAGLRALEEAEDFVPRGTQLEAEMALEVVCASHRTPLAREVDLATVLPSQMLDRYNRYAQLKLALAVAGEPAGSMALYTLGKLNSQLGATEPEQHRQSTRRAVAFQQAALLAHDQNYLAAHELGVLLAETGHLPQACQLLEQVASREPNAVVFRNLARVHEELGHGNVATACRLQADQLASSGRGPAAQVTWLSPQQFAQAAPLNESPQLTAASPDAAPVAPQVASRASSSAVRY